MSMGMLSPLLSLTVRQTEPSSSNRTAPSIYTLAAGPSVAELQVHLDAAVGELGVLVDLEQEDSRLLHIAGLDEE